MSGPAAEPELKDRIAFSMYVVLTFNGWYEVSGDDGSCKSVGEDGCFSRRASTVYSLKRANTAFELKRRTAPVMSPSAILDSTLFLSF